VGCRRRGETLRIDICDTGPGIPEDQRSSIFGEFYQLARSEAGRREGLGLGLAIVDRLCRLLGHRVEVQSHPGRGSRFSVTVPLAVEPYAESEMPALPSPMTDPAHGKRVLVIDDEVLVLDAMRGILQGWGCAVETATSGAAALARLEGSGAPPDVIISDSRLADGRSGIDAIAGVRATVGAAIPALIITGDTAPERLREASAAGFPLLHKPVSPMALRTTLNRLLKASAPSPHSGSV
jgi:CheY-like chemotaxis protein